MILGEKMKILSIMKNGEQLLQKILFCVSGGKMTETGVSKKRIIKQFWKEDSAIKRTAMALSSFDF